MRTLILADGDPPSPALAQRLAREADLRIATDGAAHKALTLGIAPDILCGDFDSVDLDAARLAFPLAAIVPTPDQSCADLEKAVLLAQERGASALAILGATGGRMDHTLSSFALLQRYADRLPICLVTDHKEESEEAQRGRKEGAAVLWAVTAGRQCLFTAAAGDMVSLISFTGAIVSIQGVHWPLDAFDLQPGTRGVSNIAHTRGEDSAPITVTVQKGSLFIVHSSPQPVGFGYYTALTLCS